MYTRTIFITIAASICFFCGTVVAAETDLFTIFEGSAQFNEFVNKKFVEKQNFGLVLRGFEHLPNFSNEEFWKVLSDTYPKGLLNTLTDIQYEPFEYCETGDSTKKCFVGFVEWGLFADAGASMRIFKNPIGETTIEYILLHVAHELGHVNSWENYIGSLTRGERLDMLSDVLRAYQSPGHFSGKVIEAYENVVYRDRIADPDILYRLVTEYWADLFREYVLNPELLKEKFPRDFSVAEKWITRMASP